MKIRIAFFWGLALCLNSSFLFAQAAIERHIWQEKRTFHPDSSTAASITGPVTLSGNQYFASPSSKMVLTFGNGKRVALTSVGAKWNEWSLSTKRKITAEVFRLGSDPGPLFQGNSLCDSIRSSHAIYVAFYEEDQALVLAFFSSPYPPSSINSKGLCGIFYYKL